MKLSQSASGEKTDNNLSANLCGTKTSERNLDCTVSDIRNLFFETLEPETQSSGENPRHIEESGTYEKSNLIKPNPVLAIGDLDADFSALVRIMDRAGYIQFTSDPDTNSRDIRMRDKGLTGTVVQTGDFFDRGKNLLTLLEFVEALRDNGMDFRMTAGNHDLMALYAVSCKPVATSDPEFYRLAEDIIRIKKLEPGINGQYIAGSVVKHDIINNWDRHEQPHHDDLLNFANWYFEGGSKLLEEVKNLAGGNKKFPPQSLREQMESARDLLFGDTTYKECLSRLSLFEEVDDVIYLHAGIDDFWAGEIEKKGIEQINRDFREDLLNMNLRDYVVGEKRHAFWRRHSALTPRAAAVLKKMNCRCVVRGHDTMQSGKPEMRTEFGIPIANIDIGIKSGHLGGALITPDNRLTGFSQFGTEILGILRPRTVPSNRQSSTGSVVNSPLIYAPKAKIA